MKDLLHDQKPRKSGSVECLGQKFPNDDVRREHFLKLLAEKLRDPDFRKIEGFPTGSDEAILALSDPPYYTACPNPFISDFIAIYGKPYDPAVPYVKEPFSLDVVEGKNDPLYAVPSYHTKVPPKAIQNYLLHYTKPGDIVLDGFCGTGMTGVAAASCSNPNRDIGARLSQYEKGARRAILFDLSPAAAFVASVMNAPIDDYLAEGTEGELGNFIKERVLPLYANAKGSKSDFFDYAVFSDWGECVNCGGDFLLHEVIVDYDQPAILSEYKCPHCDVTIKSDSAKKKFETIYDPWLGENTRLAKTSMVLISKRVGQRAIRRAPGEDDIGLYTEIGQRSVKLIPKKLIYSHMTHERNNLPEYWGITHIHHFYTRRNYYALDLVAGIEDARLRRAALFCALTIMENNATRRNRFYIDKRRPNGSPIGPLSNTLYVPTLQTETNIGRKLLQVLESISKVRQVWPTSRAFISTQSATRLRQLPNSSIDFIFTDPPFGGNINYSEQNILYEWWLGVETNNKAEAITNSVQGKGIHEYSQLMTEVFTEYARVLKPGRYIVVEFHNSANAVWHSIQYALEKSGFIVSNVALLDKIQTTLHQDHKTAAVNKDLAITAYKPSDTMVRKTTEVDSDGEAVWEFVRNHLGFLPVVKEKGGAIEYIAERDPRVLFDRMVAWFIRQNVYVPLSHQEFQAGLSQRFPERDGMTFLTDQVAQYDKKRMQVAAAPQMELFVSDERSAIDWISDHLKKRPSTYQEIHPDFFEQVGAGWKKHESKPELAKLLEDNFIQYDGTGDMPSQIHSYLSTNHKDLRGLTKSDPRLIEKAKDRWYVPDPNKGQDLERKREKALLKEFDNYRAFTGRRLKEFRLEVLRAGFRAAWGNKDYQTIIDIAKKVPDEALQEDEKLLTLYDMALTRTEAGA
jgi:DNA modification methylase